MEQRCQAVLEVRNGVLVIEVARRYGVFRQTVHGWPRRYASDGLAGLADRSSKPQMSRWGEPAGKVSLVVTFSKPSKMGIPFHVMLSVRIEGTGEPSSDG